MPEADVTYADVKFKRPKTKDRSPSSDETTYSEVKTVKSELLVCVNCSQQQTGSNWKRQVTSERVALLVLSLLLVAAVVALGALGVTGWKTTGIRENITEQEHKALQTLKEENEALRKNLSAAYESGRTMQTCPPPSTCPPPPPPACPPPPICPLPSTSPPPDALRCAAGWELHGRKCYYFTTTKSSWKDGRCECRCKGGDLVKIDSREEQNFLEAKVRENMDKDEDKFWIGLTDSVEEGTWLWVDGSPLDTSLKFWSNNEPDNWPGNNTGEDCARMGEKGGAAYLKCWFDASCNVPHKSICEKAAWI